jgi:hypothetical protein
MMANTQAIKRFYVVGQRNNHRRKKNINMKSIKQVMQSITRWDAEGR